MFPVRASLCLVLVAAMTAGACGSNVSGTHVDASTRFAAFVDEFADNTTSGDANDLSATMFESRLQQTQGQLAKLHAIDAATLSFDDRIDWRFAESILRGRELEQARMQPWKKDPRTYMRFRGIASIIGRPGDPAGKVQPLLDLLRLVPRQLENGRKNLEVHIPRFRELSLFMAEGARTVFTKEVPAFAAQVPDRRTEIAEAARAAGEALESFIGFLRTELPKRPDADFAIGKETYDLMLKQQYLLPYDADSLYEYGWSEFNRTVREMEALAKRIDPSKTWQQLAVEIKNDYPDPSRMIQVHQEWVDKAGQHIKSKNLVPIPWKERVEVVPRAEYLRKTSYYGNFSRAQGANSEGVLVGQWMINPFEERWDQKTKQEYLVEHDWGVIIVTAPHETYAGHHVQSLYQMHNPRKLRQTQGISIFSEGWGLYNEQLMKETGFFPNDRITLRALQLRLWRNARVIWDVGIHTGKMSYEEAVSLLSDRVGFLRWAAELEVDGSAQAPGYRIGYFMGMSEILKMREAYAKKRGDAFSLRDFHERLLKIGNMPPALMSEALMAGASATN